MRANRDPDAAVAERRPLGRAEPAWPRSATSATTSIVSLALESKGLQPCLRVVCRPVTLRSIP